MTKSRPVRTRSGPSRQAAAGFRRMQHQPRPLPRGDRLYTPGGGNTRRTLERSSARPLAFLYQLPRWVPPVALLALLIAGFAIPGWIGGLALLVVAGFLGWLAYVSWPSLAGRGRVLRVAAIACVLVLAVIQGRR